MKTKKLIKATEGAKKAGYEFMSTVIKKEKDETLYHLVSIDVILQFQKWPTAKIEILETRKVTLANGRELEFPQHGVRVYKKLPEKTISKAEALRKYS